jgi:hypothetical protein
VDINYNVKINKRQTIKFWTIYRFPTGTVTVHEISTLDHELLVLFLGWGGGEIRKSERVIETAYFSKTVN